MLFNCLELISKRKSRDYKKKCILRAMLVVSRTRTHRSFLQHFGHHAEYASCHFEEIHCVFTSIKLVESSRSIAKLHEAELGIEDILGAESHPLVQKFSSLKTILNFL
jgi:hypothetical protein